MLHYSVYCYQNLAIKTMIDESNLALRSPFFWIFIDFAFFYKEEKNQTFILLFSPMTTTFKDLGLTTKTLTALEKKGFKTPYPRKGNPAPPQSYPKYHRTSCYRNRENRSFWDSSHRETHSYWKASSPQPRPYQRTCKPSCWGDRIFSVWKRFKNSGCLWRAIL